MSDELSSSHAGGQLKAPDFDTQGIDDVLMAGDKSKGGRPYFLEDPSVERVMNITMAVATELAVVRERLDTLERLLERQGLLSRADMEAFVPTEAQAAERQGWHARYAARILRIVQQEIQAVAEPENNRDMHQIADDINTM